MSPSKTSLSSKLFYLNNLYIQHGARTHYPEIKSPMLSSDWASQVSQISKLLRNKEGTKCYYDNWLIKGG